MYRIQIIPYRLHFKQPAGTSRGIYNTRQVWYILLESTEEPGRWGIGECAPLPDLSCDALPNYEEILVKACGKFAREGIIDIESLRRYPSILCGLEMAYQHYKAGCFRLWDTAFSRGKAGIPINGLIWMGDYPAMLKQVETKMEAGFRCIKLKIGAIDFEKELALIRHIRQHFSAKEIELRVDANGAFSPTDAIDKLSRLAELDLHSIEQPIRAGQWEEMARLTSTSPLPIALDEELIGIYDPLQKRKLLSAIRPQYIILKPSLHGGFSGSEEWINEANRLGIGWWITSALESNIGLNAIAQWSATFENPLPQGLGTGMLFTNNIEMPMSIRKDCLWFEPKSELLSRFSKETFPTFTRRAGICINNIWYTPSDIRKLHSSASDKTPEIVRDLYAFLIEWFDDSPFIEVQTSGSTGKPKTIIVRKEQMINSAKITCSFLRLREGNAALLCLPLQYIAGKMMVIRAIIAGMNLIVREPSGHPLRDINSEIKFAAMTPMQVYNSFEHEDETGQLKDISTLIIGGGFISQPLEQKIKELPNTVYATYGMAETLSHIALRRINGDKASDHYTPLSSVELSLSADSTLIINAPLVNDNALYTNDIAELLPDGRFRILGRKDNIINSGGIKIQIEKVEEALQSVISFNFAITSVPDQRLGEAVALLVATDKETVKLSEIEHFLSPFERPRYIWKVDHIPTTKTGKTDRAACRQLALSIYQTIKS